MGLGAYLCVSVALFALGLCCVIARKNLLHVLIGLQLLLAAASLVFAAFARFHGAATDGRVMALFVLVVAAVEAVVGIAVVLHVVRASGTARPSAFDRLRE
ncbi:MAG TPA: NADH-quinone oxidoreductase subunit NuoK [Planctomycetota bacterium]|nr:NADH-quinone oxidoreductase subunit NuoK [Planctomycetota bacterium]